MAAGRIKGITIEIGGDTTKLTKALSSVDNAIKTTQTNIRDLDKALKLDPTNTNLLKDKQKELSVEIENTKKKLETEKEALKQMAQTEGFDKDSQAARNLQTQIDLDTVALKELEKQAKASCSVLGSQMQAAGQQIQEVGNKIKSVGDSLISVGRTLTTHVTAPIAAGFAAIIKTTADFDAEMSKVQAISGATADDMGRLTEKAREMGEQTKFSATESGQAFEYMAMAGWKTEDMLQGIDGIMNLAAASGEELGTTSDIVTDALTAFGLEAKDAGRFADILAAAASNANTNVSMMGESFKYVAPVAGSLGYSAEDVAVALGLMANSGIKADMAGTSLRNMFQRMAKPTKESDAAMTRLGLTLADDSGRMYSFREIMDQLRVSFQDINISAEEYLAQLDELDADLESGNLTQTKYNAALEELNKQCFGAEGAEKARAAAMLGGTRAMAGLLAIANASTADYEQLTTAIDGSSDAFARLADGSVVPLNEALLSGQEIIEQYDGAAAAMSATMMNNLTGDITILKSQLQELAISLGTLIMPLLREIVEKVQGVVDWLNNLDDGTKKMILTIAAVAAAVGPVLMLVGGVISAIGTIVSAIGTLVSGLGTVITAVTALGAPIIAIIAAVGALVAAFVYFYNTNEEFRNKVNAVIEFIKNAFLTFVQNVKQWLSEIIQWVSPIIESAKSMLSALVDFIKAAFDAIKFVIKAFIGDHQTEINAFMINVRTIFQVGFELIKGIITTVLNVLKAQFQATFDTVTNILKAFTALLRGDWKGALDAMKAAASSAINGVFNVFNSLRSGLSNTLSGIINSMRQWGADMINNLISGITSKISGVANAISSVANTVKSYIHFTEPDVGPLADFHTYMPDMIKEMVHGIDKGIPQIESAMDSMASAMVPGVTGAIQNAGSTTNNTSNAITMNIYGAEGQDVRELADVIQSRINQEVYMTGAVFA